MHREWQEFLESRGARFEDCDGVPCVAEFASVDGPDAPEVADLSPLGLLCIEGPDAARFLQGYATCDLRELTAGRALPGALCTREGRTLATYRVWGTPEHLTLRLHRALIVPVRDLLAKYIVFSKAELDEPGPARLGIGLAGEGAAERVATVCGRAPEHGEVLTTPVPETFGVGGEVIALRDRGEPPRFELWLPAAAAPRIWDRLAGSARPVPWSRWQAYRIRAGFVELSPRTAAEYVPQALNLQACGMISFTKGCYLGQEVVARMQHLGKLKKRLYRFTIPGLARPPGLGSEVTLGETKPVGEVVAAACDEGDCEVLAVVRTDAADETLEVEGHPLQPAPLPYDIPELRPARETV